MSEVDQRNRAAGSERKSPAVWQARKAVLVALPEICREEISELLASVQHAAQDGRRHSTATIVRQWTKRQNLNRVWIVNAVTSMVSQSTDLLLEAFTGGSSQEAWKHPQIWREQLWADPTFFAHMMARQQVFAEYDGSNSLKPIGADPLTESQEAFLQRSKNHYLQRSADLTARGWVTHHERPEMERDARWVLLYQVRRLSCEKIAREAQVSARRVKEAVKRFAALVELPRRAPVQQTNKRGTSTTPKVVP